MGLIYKITNPINEVYIGSTKRSNISSRMNEHKYQSKKRKTFLAKSFSTYGSYNHKAEIISEVEEENRMELEHFVIQEFEPSLNMVSKYNNTAQGKIWVNNGSKEFQILPKLFRNYENINKGRLKTKT